MKKHMLFTGYNTDDRGIFQGDFDTAPEALHAVKDHSDDEMYKIIEAETNRVLAWGPIKNLINLLNGPNCLNGLNRIAKSPAGARVGMALTLSPAPSG